MLLKDFGHEVTLPKCQQSVCHRSDYRVAESGDGEGRAEGSFAEDSFFEFYFSGLESSEDHFFVSCTYQLIFLLVEFEIEDSGSGTCPKSHQGVFLNVVHSYLVLIAHRSSCYQTSTRGDGNIPNAPL